ncbi:hypothetical protein GGX14DRAFT_563357 [Mycena pura]|uniref:Uncharacterized protein n=1 Tax=Mycena pura TaxID=153505 RepID=A0AAD6VMX8_9AGAR|nr:hypothetical protein GGX14DRAFT_563357 [Mycena pura]
MPSCSTYIFSSLTPPLSSLRQARSTRPRHSHPVARNLRNARTQLAEHARVAHAPSHPHASGKSAPRATAHSLAHSARSIARRTPPIVCRAPPACIAQDSRPPNFPAARRRTPDRESFSLPALPSVLIIVFFASLIRILHPLANFCRQTQSRLSRHVRWDRCSRLWGTAPPSVPTDLGEEFTGHSPRLSGGNFSQPPTDIVRVERAPTLMARLPREFINVHRRRVVVVVFSRARHGTRRHPLVGVDRYRRTHAVAESTPTYVAGL